MSFTDELFEKIESRPVGDGDLIGENFRLLPWQKAFLIGAWRSKISRAAVTLGRGGGKSGLFSAIALETLLPDGALHKKGFETVIVASAFNQGCIIGGAVRMSLELLGFSLGAKKDYRLLDSTQHFEIRNNESKARIKVYGSDSKRAHGLRPNLLLCDEPAQWLSGGSRLSSALKTALGKRKGGKILLCGTRPASQDHFFEKILREEDKAVFSKIYAADRETDPFNEKTWKLANPGLPQFPDIEILRTEARIAKRDSSELASFRALRLNQGTSDIDEAYLIDPDTWKGAEVSELPEAKGSYSLGLDLGGVAAFSAAAAYWPATGRLEGFQACGGIPSIAERSKLDGVGDLYPQMEARGELIVYPGKRVVPLDEFLKEVISRFGRPSAVSCDRWRSGELSDAVNLSKLRLPFPAWRGQGFKDGNTDIRAFKTQLFEGKVHAPKSLAMRSAFAEARTLMDPAGNQKLAVKSEAGRRKNARDDLTAAVILAIAEGSRIDSFRRPGIRYRGAV